MKNELKITGCDYWGEYDGYKVFKCYRGEVPNHPNIVFALGNKLFMNGEYVGDVDSGGRVSNWDPNKAVRKRPTKTKFIEFNSDIVENSKSAEEVLSDSWRRSVEELVGEKFSTEYKYSE